MDFNTYSELALISCKKFGDFEQDMRHGLIGLITEVGELADTVKRNWIYGKELDKVNLKEEIGDILWYFNVIVTECNYTFEDIFNSASRMIENSDLEDLVFQMSQTIGDILSNFKENDSRTMTSIVLFASHIISFCEQLQFSIQEIMEQNINKLKKRYPQGYTNQDALERKDKQDDGTGNTEQNSVTA